MSAQNQLTLMGNVGGANSIRRVDGDDGKVKVLSFSLAVNEFRYNPAPESKQNERMTDWHNVKAFGFVADRLSRFVEQGQALLLSGRLYKEEYETSEGEKRTSFGLEVEDFALISGGRGSANEAPQVETVEDAEDDFPF